MTTEELKQIERIKMYEKIMVDITRALDTGDSIDHDLIRELESYYLSEEWKKDLADDEAGLLPQDLRRGVLSEDGIYDLLERYREKVEDMNGKKLAVVFPGIGYHKDKPLLYYPTKLAISRGYDVIHIEYHDMPQKIRGNIEMMRKAAEMAYEQASKQLGSVDWNDCSDVLFIGKSIGTVVMAKYAAEHDTHVRQIWYTPVEGTFLFGAEDVIAFIGDDDPWSDVAAVKNTAAAQNIRLHSYPGCNHSLECEDVSENILILRDVIDKTEEYIGR